MQAREKRKYTPPEVKRLTVKPRENVLSYCKMEQSSCEYINVENPGS